MGRESDDGLTKASRSPLIRKLLSWLLSAAALWLAAWIKGWEDGIARVPDVQDVAARVAKIEQFIADAGLDVEVLEVESAETRKLVDEESLAAQQHVIDVHRDMVLISVPPARAASAIKDYERLIAKGIKPHDAMDIVLGWSRPPGK